MSCTDENRQEERTQRSEERDAVGVLTQQSLGNLDEPVHTARGLHDACTGDGSDDDVDDVGRGRTGFQTETEHQQCESDARDGAECQTAVTRTNPECSEHDQELKNH